MGSMPTSFLEIPYARLDLDRLNTSYQELLASFDSDTTAKGHVESIERWNTLRTEIATTQGLAEVHYTQNVADPATKAEKDFYDKSNPTLAEWNKAVSEKVLASPHRVILDQRFGELFFRQLEQHERTFSPAIKDLLIEESELCNKYNEITASAKIEVNGSTYNLSSIGSLLISLDRDVRRAATEGIYGFLEQNRTQIDSIYDRLVHLRTEKAQALGFPSYIEFRYVEFGRLDYNAADVETFRAQVIEHVVPLVEKFRIAQARRIGVDAISLYDEKLQFVDGNPIAHGDHDFIVAQAARMYAELSPETNEFFQLMLDKDLMDLKTRDNKATGGYCTTFPSYGLPFIFANFNQTTHDVEVLTHEAGHAFQAYRSRQYEVPEYRWPTAEACEVHSMGMEFLTWPWMKYFFEEQTDKFRFYHLQGALLFLPYGCAVDHFQHWVYANPNATPADRNAFWKKMEATYLPWRKSEDIPYAAEGTAWQLQRHIYESPFYYIDYALAQTCALQFWKRSQEDQALAFADYLRICDIGGSKTFLGIVEAGNLRSPFKPGTLADIVETANGWLTSNFAQFML